MNFSEPISSELIPVISSNSLNVASVSQCNLTIRSTATLSVTQSYTCDDVVDNFAWSPDSHFILCVLKKQGIVQIFSLDDLNWKSKLAEASVNLISAEWVPDSRHVLTTTEFHLRITIWTLSGDPIAYYSHVKACTNNFGFSPTGRFLAVLTRLDFRDQFSIIDSKKVWTCLRTSRINTSDAIGVLWSPDGRNLAIWDDCLRYRVVIYCVDGRQLHTYCAYDLGEDLLGVKSVSWSPTGQLLALGSYDQKCRILTDTNWACLATLAHPVDKPIHPHLGLNPFRESNRESDLFGGSTESHGYRPHRVDVYDECRPVKVNQTSTERCQDEQSGVVYRITEESITVRSIRVNPKLPFPKIGIGLLAFSTDGRFLATRNDNAPHTIWIWSIDRRLSLFSLLLHSNAVTALAWDPTSPSRLALCTASDAVFMWTPQGCLAVQIPSHFKFTVSSVVWLPSGESLLLWSDSHFSLCHLQTENALSTRSTHANMWKPPHLSAIQGSGKQLIDSPLPTGVFGCGDQTHEVEDTLGDGPNWLKQHHGCLSERSRGAREERRNSSSHQAIRKPSRSAGSPRPVSLVATKRQPWVPMVPTHELPVRPTSTTP